jgi:hypothetical protein
LARNPVGNRVALDLLLESHLHRSVLRSLQDDPRLGLAEDRIEMSAREIIVRMQVHGKSLPSVQELDQDRHVRSESGHMLLAEIAVGIGGDHIPQQVSVGESREPNTWFPEGRHHRSDPLLRRVRIGTPRGAKGGDAFPAPVETVELIGREQDRLHRAHSSTTLLADSSLVIFLSLVVASGAPA